MKNQSKTDESMDVLEQLKQLSAMMREQKRTTSSRKRWNLVEVWHTKKKKEVSQVQIDDEATCIEAIKLWQEEFITRWIYNGVTAN